MIKKFAHWAEKHIPLLLLILVGLVLTIRAIDYEIVRRGSVEIGGEYLILPFLLIVYYSLKADWTL